MTPEDPSEIDPYYEDRVGLLMEDYDIERDVAEKVYPYSLKLNEYIVQMGSKYFKNMG